MGGICFVVWRPGLLMLRVTVAVNFLDKVCQVPAQATFLQIKVSHFALFVSSIFRALR